MNGQFPPMQPFPPQHFYMQGSFQNPPSHHLLYQHPHQQQHQQQQQQQQQQRHNNHHPQQHHLHLPVYYHQPFYQPVGYYPGDCHDYFLNRGDRRCSSLRSTTPHYPLLPAVLPNSESRRYPPLPPPDQSHAPGIEITFQRKFSRMSLRQDESDFRSHFDRHSTVRQPLRNVTNADLKERILSCRKGPETCDPKHPRSRQKSNDPRSIPGNCGIDLPAPKVVPSPGFGLARHRRIPEVELPRSSFEGSGMFQVTALDDETSLWPADTDLERDALRLEAVDLDDLIEERILSPRRPRRIGSRLVHSTPIKESRLERRGNASGGSGGGSSGGGGGGDDDGDDGDDEGGDDGEDDGVSGVDRNVKDFAFRLNSGGSSFLSSEASSICSDEVKPDFQAKENKETERESESSGIPARTPCVSGPPAFSGSAATPAGNGKTVPDTPNEKRKKKIFRKMFNFARVLKGLRHSNSKCAAEL